MEDLVVRILEWATTNGLAVAMSLLTAAAILVIGWMAAKWIRSFLKKLMTDKEIDPTLIGFSCNLIYFALMTFVVLAALGQMGIQTTSLVAVIGAAGLAVGFALQGSLSNFAAGVLLIIFRPFVVGDYIEAAGVSGTVDLVQIFTTHLKTPDNKKVIIPNSKLSSDNIINYSAMDIRRIDMTFGIGYDDDIKKAKEVLQSILNDDPRVLKDPAITVAVSELADSSVNFAVRPWVKTEDYWSVYFDVTETVKLTFDKEGISIPFPQQDVHMHEVKPAPTKKKSTSK